MIRDIYCVGCGGPRTFDTTRRHQDGGARMTCLRCGHTVFTTLRPVARTARWSLTPYDREFLASLRIAPEGVRG